MSEATLNRNVELVREFDETDKSVRDIGYSFGLSEKMTRKLLREYGRDPSARKKRTRQRLTEKEPLSRLHIQIGQDIALERHRMGLTPTAFASHARLSKDRLRAIEYGVYEVTISELQRICDVLKLSIDQLMKLRTVMMPV